MLINFTFNIIFFINVFCLLIIKREEKNIKITFFLLYFISKQLPIIYIMLTCKYLPARLINQNSVYKLKILNLIVITNSYKVSKITIIVALLKMFK